MKKVLTFLVLFVLAFALVACSTNTEVEIKGVSISSTSNTVKVNQTVQLEAKVFPENADQSVTWKSENPSIATVDEKGLVTGVSEGSATIIATSVKNSEISGSYIVLVEKEEEVVIEPTGVTITAVGGGATSCKVGEEIALSATVSPENASQSVVWSTSDETVASVNKGKVKGVKAGTVTITATAKGHATVFATIEITIEPADAPAPSKDWDKMEYTTHADFLTAEDGASIKVKGVVTYIHKEKDDGITYGIQNGSDGFYIYKQNGLSFPVEVGGVYEIGGFKKDYNGFNEIVDVEYCQKLDEKITYTANSIDAIDPSDLAATKPYQGSIVTATAVLTEADVNESKAYSFYGTINGKSATFRVDPSNMSDEEFKAINKVLLSSINNTEFTFKGVMVAFGYGKKQSPQIQIISADHLEFAEVSAKELLEAIGNSLSVTKSISFSVNSITLPTSIEGWDEVRLTWSSNSDLINVATGAVNHASENTTVTLTATLSYQGESVDKTFDVLVFALDNNEYEVLASLDLEDAAPADKYGSSSTKSSYAEAIVQLGTPKNGWMLRNALIAGSQSDRFDGTFSIRAKSGNDADSTARIEIQQAGEYNVVEFSAATYGNDKNGAQIRIEYTTDDGKTWTASAEVIEISSTELVAYRVKLPEGAKRVAIVVVENTGTRVNIDNIKLMK